MRALSLQSAHFLSSFTFHENNYTAPFNPLWPLHGCSKHTRPLSWLRVLIIHHGHSTFNSARFLESGRDDSHLAPLSKYCVAKFCPLLYYVDFYLSSGRWSRVWRISVEWPAGGKPTPVSSPFSSRHWPKIYRHQTLHVGILTSKSTWREVLIYLRSPTLPRFLFGGW